MDILILITTFVIGFLIAKSRGSSKDALSHSSTEATLKERQSNKELELKKIDEELEKIEKEMKEKDVNDIEKYWNKK